MAEENKEALPWYIVHKVDHYKQNFNWDCGVSCVLMLLSKVKREEFVSNFNKICEEEGFGQSTWTIDLCYLLKRYEIRHCMYTTTIGVNEHYKKQSYYNKIIDLDRDRVKRRFDTAIGSGLEVKVGSIGTDILVSHLAHSGPALVLVDAGLLVCDLCKHNKLKAEFRRCFGGSYTGHYILVIGYNLRSQKVLYRDPALSPRLCAVSASRLRHARVAQGTDQDIILVYNSYR